MSISSRKFALLISSTISWIYALIFLSDKISLFFLLNSSSNWLSIDFLSLRSALSVKFLIFSGIKVLYISILLSSMHWFNLLIAELLSINIL